MKPLTFSWYDYIIFVVMVAFSTVIGIYYGIFDKNKTEASTYFSGGKQLKVFPMSISLIASFLSVTDLLAIPAEVYMHGTQFWVAILSFPLVCLIINYFYLPIAYRLNLNSTFDYLELRYNKILRRVMIIAFACNCILFAPILVYTPTLAFSQVTGFNTHYVRWIITVICVFYTTIGGFKAVIWSDTLQFVITISTLFLSLVIGVSVAGGLKSVWNVAENGERIEFFSLLNGWDWDAGVNGWDGSVMILQLSELKSAVVRVPNMFLIFIGQSVIVIPSPISAKDSVEEIDPNPTIRSTFWSVLIGTTSYSTAVMGIHLAATQRLFSLKTLKDAQRVLVIFCIATMIAKFIVCFLGIVMYARYATCDPLSIGMIERPDQIVAYYVLDLEKEMPVVSVLFISGLFSMSFSVLSTVLNVLAYILYSDVVLPLFPKISDRSSNYVTKGITILVGLVSVALVSVIERLGSIFEITYAVGGTLSGALLGLVVMGLIFPFANTKGAYYGGIGAITLMSFIIFKTNTYVWNGEIQSETKPLNTDGCLTNFTLGSTIVSNSSSPISDGKSQPPWLFRISFYYYTLMGCVIVIVIGLLVSLVTRRVDDLPVKHELISPVICKLIDKTDKYRYHQPISAVKINVEASSD